MTGGLLLHACCGPCAAYPLKKLLPAGRFAEIRLFFYNPNIHPPQEHHRRRDSLAYLGAAAPGLFGAPPGSLAMDFPEYDPYAFFRIGEGILLSPLRCRMCYRLRLRRTASEAKDLGMREFSTTLLFSRQQKHEVIIEEGEFAAAEFGVSFFYEDFRAGHKEGRRLAAELGLYRQSHCGCVYGCVDN